MIGLDLWTIGLAFLAGLVSFASPCVLPLVPSYLGFLAGSKSTKRRDFGRTAAFVLGFTTVFVLLGTLFAGGAVALGGALSFVRIGAGVLVMILAVNLVWDFIPFLNFEKRLSVSSAPQSLPAAFLVGTAFGAGWTPCIGPYLAGILFMAGTSEQALSGSFLLAIYSLGLGLPFVLLSLAFDSLSSVWSWMKKHLIGIKRGGAILMFLMGLLIAFDQTTALPRVLVQSGDALLTWAVEAPIEAKLTSTLALYALLLGAVAVTFRFWVRRWVARAILVAVDAGLVTVLFLVTTDRFNLIASVGHWLQFQGI